jgi:hypothetical protein
MSLEDSHAARHQDDPARFSGTAVTRELAGRFFDETV